MLTISIIRITPWERKHFFLPNSQMQKTKAESGQGTCSTSHSWEVTELRFDRKLQSLEP